MTSADVLQFLADMARAIGAGILALFFVASAVIGVLIIVRAERNARERRNREALRVDVSA